MPARGTNEIAEAAFARVSSICLRFAGADVKLSHGAPAFHVKGKGFATFSRGGYGETGPALWTKSTHDEQRRLVEQDPARYFVPPYVGVSGWVAVRLDPALGPVGPNDVDLAILVENGWSAIVPKSLASGAPRPPSAAKTAFKLPMTDETASAAALAQLRALAEAYPDVTTEVEARSATFRASGKVFAYFLDNHHGDEIIAACVRVPREDLAREIGSSPKRYYLPQYIGPKGWLGIRLNAKGAKPDWKDVKTRLAASFALVTAAKKAAAKKKTVTKKTTAKRPAAKKR
jgi:hypothetical protein